MAGKSTRVSNKPPPVRSPSSRFRVPEPQRHASTKSTNTQPQGKVPTRTSTIAKNPSIRSTAGSASHRPANTLQRQETIRTRYMDMLLQLDLVPRSHNILSAFFGWLLLAGFLVFPGTFTRIEKLSTDPDLAAESPTANVILNGFKNLPLLVIASIACGVGAVGLIWLAFCWRRNYIWLLNRIFLPSTTNAVAGLISTLITVFAQNDGEWSLMAEVTAAVEAVDLVVCGSLFVISTVMLELVKRKHKKEIGKYEGEKEEEGILDKAERKWNEPAAAQQSVV